MLCICIIVNFTAEMARAVFGRHDYQHVLHLDTVSHGTDQLLRAMPL